MNEGRDAIGVELLMMCEAYCVKEFRRGYYEKIMFIIVDWMFNVTTGAFAADNASDSAHMNQVLEQDSSYEGFLANSETLTFEEIASLPGASVISEYDSLLELKMVPTSELFKMGMSMDNVEKIKSKSVKELVLDNAATYTDEILASKGLSDTQIDALRDGNYETITIEEARDVGAHLALGIASISESGNNLNYNIYWHWDNSRPLNLIQDGVATSITNNYYVVGGATAKIWYAPLNSMTPVANGRISPISSSGSNSTGFYVPMQKSTSGGLQWTQAGKAFIPTTGNNTGRKIDMFAEYFHKWTNLSISIANGHISFPVGSGELTTASASIH